MKTSTVTKMLSATSLLGLAATVGIAIKTGVQLDSLYEMYTSELNYNHDKPANEIKMEYASKAARECIPLAISTAATAASIIFQGKHSLKTEAALVSALYLSRQQLQRATDRKRTDIFLEDKQIPQSKGRILLYEPYTDQIIPTTEAKIRKAEDKANARLQQYYLVRLSSIIRDLGGKPCSIADYIGWETANEMQMKQWKIAGDVYIRLDRYDAHYSVTEKPLDFLDYDIPPAMLTS